MSNAIKVPKPVLGGAANGGELHYVQQEEQKQEQAKEVVIPLHELHAESVTFFNNGSKDKDG